MYYAQLDLRLRVMSVGLPSASRRYFMLPCTLCSAVSQPLRSYAKRTVSACMWCSRSPSSVGVSVTSVIWSRRL
ncbi:hypothetical protein ECN1_0208 [Escherichia coli N1]|nr:hypothetical protein ECN1_0208 [Escherichia coli N1]